MVKELTLTLLFYFDAASKLTLSIFFIIIFLLGDLVLNDP